VTTTQRPGRPRRPSRSGSVRPTDDGRARDGQRVAHDDRDAEDDRDRPLMPSEVTDRVGSFDRFAGGASRLASRAPFFAFCVLLVIVWAPTYFVFRNVDTWQLIINTMTTIVTFLMVALLQNSQYRNDEATQHKLNAIADGLADLMTYVAHHLDGARDRDADGQVAGAAPHTDGDGDGDGHDKLEKDLRELRRAVGLEDKESSA